MCSLKKLPTSLPVDNEVDKWTMATKHDLSVFPKHDQKVIKQAIKAMKSGECLQIEYDGYPRVVEVHAVGVSRAGRPCMRAYQVIGDSHHGEPYGWKMFTISKIFQTPNIISIHSLAPREGYKQGDAGMSTIIEEL